VLARTLSTYYARRKSTSEDRDTTLTYDSKGEDPLDLRDSILRAESLGE
jgi:hypothetical protein